ncbi:MAG: Wzz/FepE/Etk N-terminal domain-containing protein, partial [Gemmatimonadota bacterium]
MSGLIQPGGDLPAKVPADSAWPRIIAAPVTGAAAGGELGDLKEILGIARRRRWVLALCALGGAGIAAYLAYQAKPVYLATASVRIADARQSIAGGIADVPRDNYGGSFGVDPVLSQIQVLKSREVAADAIHRQPLGLIVYPDGFPATDVRDVRVDTETLGSALLADFAADGYTLQEGKREISARYGQPVTTGGVTFSIASRPAHRSGAIGILALNNAVGMLLDGVDARPRKSTDVVDVTYRANDPYVAQQVVNAIVSSYKAVNANNSQQLSRRRREFIQEQLKQTDSLFADATQSLSAFRSSSQVYGSDSRVSAEQTGLMTLDVTREQLAADKSTLQSLLDKLHDVSVGKSNEKLDALLASPGVAGNPVVSALFAQLVQLRVRRDSLTVGAYASSKNNPDVLKLDTLITTTNAELISAVRSNLQSDDARLASLDALRSRNATNLQRLPAVQAVEARLLQRVETARKMADQLREEYQRARIS